MKNWRFFMKKLFAFVFGIAFVCASAFADISFGVGGRGTANLVSVDWSKIEPEHGDSDENTETAKAGAYFLSDFNFSAQTEDKKLGFNFDLEFATGANTLDDENYNIKDFSIPDQAKVWWQPTEWLLAQIGMIEVDDLRGSVGDWGVGRRDIGSLGEDDIFDRFYPQAGVAVSLYPVEGLFIGATFDTDQVNDYEFAENFYKGLNVGAGYTIDDKFQIKFAYFGAQDKAKATESDELEDDDYNGKLEFGFDWALDENNVLEIGVKVPLWSDEDARKAAADDAYAFKAVAGFAGANDNLSYKAHAGFVSLKGIDKDGDLDFYPSIELDGGLEAAFDDFTLGGTVQYAGAFNNLLEKSVNANTFGAEVYIKKDIAADCFVFGGIADKFVVVDEEDNVKTSENTFYIPVGIEFAF